MKTKKNIAMRIALIVMVIALATTCIVSGTFAKYVTSDTGSDTARVAKWGVTVVAVTAGVSDDQLFAKAYEQFNNSGRFDVNSTVNVVAPGTKEAAAAFKLTGTPEVAVKLTVEPTANFKIGKALATKGTAAYEPIKWTLLKGSASLVTDGTFEALKTELGKISDEYAAGSQDLSTLDRYQISWKWDFDSANDAKDTILGDAVADPTAYIITDATGEISKGTAVPGTSTQLAEADFVVTLDFVVSVTQLDKPTK